MIKALGGGDGISGAWAALNGRLGGSRGSVKAHNRHGYLLAGDKVRNLLNRLGQASTQQSNGHLCTHAGTALFTEELLLLQDELSGTELVEIFPAYAQFGIKFGLLKRANLLLGLHFELIKRLQ